MITIGEKLRMLRHNKHVTQAKVCKQLGISVQSLSRYENDQAEPDMDVLYNLADYYNVDINYLYNYAESKKKVTDYRLVNGDSSLLSKYHTCSKDLQRLIKRLVDESYKIELERSFQKRHEASSEREDLLVCEDEVGS